ncbi:unnamed protein product, partial [Ascophyllum nodosum]
RDGDHLQRSRGQRQHRPRGGNHVPDGVRRATSAVRTSLPGLCRHRGLRREFGHHDRLRDPGVPQPHLSENVRGTLWLEQDA